LRRAREGKSGSAVRRTSTRGSCPGRVASLRRVPRPAFHAAAPTYTYCLSRRVQRLSALAFRSGGTPRFGLLLRRCPTRGAPPPLQAITKKSKSVVSPRPPRFACSGTSHAPCHLRLHRVGHSVSRGRMVVAPRKRMRSAHAPRLPHALTPCKQSHHGGTPRSSGTASADARRPRRALRCVSGVRRVANRQIWQGAWAVLLHRSGGGRGSGSIVEHRPRFIFDRVKTPMVTHARAFLQ
jgi:hypothetical protein